MNDKAFPLMTHNISRVSSPFMHQENLFHTSLQGRAVQGESLSARQAMQRLSEWAALPGITGERRQEAMSRITQAYQDNDSELSLDDLELSSFPPHLDVLLPNLENLVFDNNKLQNLQGMPRLDRLESLSLTGNGLQSLQGMTKPDALLSLDLKNNQLQSLSHMPILLSLEKLDLEGNRMESLSSMPSLDNLSTLNVCHNRIGSLDGMPTLYSLNTLNIRNNQLRFIHSLKEQTELRELYLDENSITDLSDLGDLSSLQKLTVDNNPLRGLAGLPTGITSLEARGCGLTDLSGVENLVWLTELAVSRNHLTHLNELSACSELISVHANENPVSDTSTLHERGVQVYANINVSQLPSANSNDSLPQNMNSLMDPADDVPPAAWAAQRWRADSQITSKQADAFLRSTVPPLLFTKLTQEIPGGEALLRMCAGQVYSAASTSQNTMAQVTKRLQNNMAYLQQHVDNEALMQEVLEVADDAVNRCGDRVSYGETRLHHVLETHRLTNEALPALQVLHRLESSYNQVLLEDFAARISSVRGENSAEESVELYLSLAAQVKSADQRIPLHELAVTSMFGHLHKATESDVQSALNLLRNKQGNLAWKEWLLEHPATGTLLDNTFSISRQRMEAHREILSEAGYDLMSGNPLSCPVDKVYAAYRYVYRRAAPDISQISGEALLKKSGELENIWREKVLEEVLKNPALLDVYRAG